MSASTNNQYVTMDHKTSHKGKKKFFIEIYASS